MKTFEDIQIWKDAKTLAIEIYSIDFKKDFGFKDQIQRASVSVLSNIAKGFERGSNKDFIKFLFYSKGSVGEIRSLISLASDLKYIDETLSHRLFQHCLNLSKQISNFIKYLKTHITTK